LPFLIIIDKILAGYNARGEKMSDLDRMFANNQDSTRMNQAKQIAKSTAEIALLAVGIHGKGVLGKTAGNLATPAAGSAQDIGGLEAAKIKATKDAARIKATNETARMKAANAASKRPGAATPKPGYDTLYEAGKKKLNDAKFLHPKENIVGQALEKLDKEKISHAFGKGAEFVGRGVLSQVGAEAKKQLPPEVSDLIKTRSELGGIRNSLDAFKGLSSLDTNGVINGIAKLTLGKPDLTHGVVGYANKVLKGLVAPGKKTLEAQTAMAKMHELESTTNTLVDKNLKILKDNGLEAPLKKASTKEEQETLMATKVPDKILKNTDWLKNKEEFSSSRKDIDALSSKVGALKRGSLDIAEETENLEIIDKAQEGRLQKVRTLVEADGKAALISMKAPEELMNKAFLTSLNLSQAEAAYEEMAIYQNMNTVKNLLTNDLQAQLTEGMGHLDSMIGKTTADLLNDTKKMFETAKKDAEDEDRSEADIRRMRKA
jgi:hypothetical protein